MKQLKVYKVGARFEAEVEAEDEAEAKEMGKYLLAKCPDKTDWTVNLEINTEYLEKGGKL